MRLMLNRNAALAIPPESHFLAKLFKRFPPTSALDDAGLSEAVDIVASTPEWQRDWHGDAEALRALLRDRAPLELGEFIESVFTQQIQPTGKPRWGDKTPAYLFQVERLRACLPEARFIAMVRDPRDVFLSLAPRDWVGTSSWQVGSYLLRCDRLVDQLAREHSNVLAVVRYEDLITRAEATVRDVCSFLSLTFEPSMLEFHIDAADSVQQWELDIGAHQKLLRPMELDDVDRWKREGERRQLREVEAVTYEAVERFDYETTMSRSTARLVAARARVRHRMSRRSASTASPQSRQE
jgi:hypothetical protein